MTQPWTAKGRIKPMKPRADVCPTCGSTERKVTLGICLTGNQFNVWHFSDVPALNGDGTEGVRSKGLPRGKVITTPVLPSPDKPGPDVPVKEDTDMKTQSLCTDPAESADAEVSEMLGKYLNTMVSDLRIFGKGEYLRQLFSRYEAELAAGRESAEQRIRELAAWKQDHITGDAFSWRVKAEHLEQRVRELTEELEMQRTESGTLLRERAKLTEAKERLKYVSFVLTGNETPLTREKADELARELASIERLTEERNDFRLRLESCQRHYPLQDALLEGLRVAKEDNEQSLKDWVRLLVEIAKVYAQIDSEWADADAGNVAEEFDPWVSIKEIGESLRVAKEALEKK